MRRATTVASPPKTEADTESETPAALVQGPPVEQSPPIQPILGAEEQNRIMREIEGRKKEISDKLGRLRARLSSHDQSLVDRIRSFVTQCDEAATRGDYTQADALSERALVLVRELQGE